MIENYLIALGLRCGTVKNFSNSVLEDARKMDCQHWYFKTPIKSADKGGNLKECAIEMAYPFIAKMEDDSESEVIDRLNSDSVTLQNELISELRKRVIVPNFTFSIIPFWANEKGGDRNERKDFAGIRVHILLAQLTIRYREHWF